MVFHPVAVGDDNDDDDGRKMSFSCLLSIADLPDDVTEVIALSLSLSLSLSHTHTYIAVFCSLKWHCSSTATREQQNLM